MYVFRYVSRYTERTYLYIHDHIDGKNANPPICNAILNEVFDYDSSLGHTLNTNIIR